MSKHLTRRAPKRKRGLCWGRTPDDSTSVVTWQLFRRDHRGAIHMSTLQFTYAEPRAYIAQRLRNARRKLRDRVDEIDLAAMGVTA
ncbi:hypothetical protein QSH46_013320 [Xanthomonas arboricola pv. juglandis]|uniref:hypothetical protein n=1 Tax=Xanthomonas arboricola TaxID=56448 RepID=UPI00063EC0CE|nr:hypothetical protein [Xanthomonas arboricola]MDN0220803.1 hypothetical protein [Xanthomonas arboricola pv. juglandis]MDN0225044.1 hypothetical protein [Xanthomonas arboricola pv. juglandis]MDN0229258.1 hypothetical protein [Xanthomonas arboricola pv. juglandis]MDN0233712.1 hypothetical protein [Xanthomonas arboricola pv. juglandis]MDN0237972.1 hypothetical protein [Xanthomonas arboricola pv. juglandis]